MMFSTSFELIKSWILLIDVNDGLRLVSHDQFLISILKLHYLIHLPHFHHFASFCLYQNARIFYVAYMIKTKYHSSAFFLNM